MGSTVCAATVIVENRVLPKRFPLRRMLEQILRGLLTLRSAAEDWHRLMLLLQTVAVSACRGPTSSARLLYTSSSNLQPATSSSRSPPTAHPLLVSAMTTSRHPGARLGAVLHAMRSWQASLIEPTWRRAGFINVIGNSNR